MKSSTIRLAVAIAAMVACERGAAAQTGGAASGISPAAGQPQSASAAQQVPAALPPGYVIGSGDVLSIVFWRDKEMSADVVVRPDGKISLPLVNDVQASGLTPDQFRSQLVQAATKYVEAPNATVVVKQINSRKVFITGSVSKPGEYPLTGDLKVLQLIALAGGLQEFASPENIIVIRNQGGELHYIRFNYRDVLKMRNVQQNISLIPGDTVVVP